MIQPKSFIICALLLFCDLISSAQKQKKGQGNNRTLKSTLVYDNINYCTDIKSVQLNYADKESAFPIIDLQKKDYLSISFDDLRSDSRALYYSVEHCNADWTPNRLPLLDALIGYDEDRIFEIQSSKNTLTAYTHYSFTFPNENIKPKIAGNFLLKVYEDADKARLLFSRKIYVLNASANLDVEILSSLLSAQKSKNQKLNIIVSSLQEIVNPAMNMQVHVFQNQRSDNYKILKDASQINPHKITYNQLSTLDFKGNNEFRTLDLRSMRSTSSAIQNIVRDGVINVQLYSDDQVSNAKYEFKPDENGRFFIRNIDFNDAALESEYISTHFSLKDSANIKGDIYLVGAFNNFNTTDENKLRYNANSRVWETKQLLKQGIYNYEYIRKSGTEIDTGSYAGSFFETENEYQIIVYYRKPGTYWDEIIGFENINTIK
jgi:hypothetical protein